MPSVHAPALRTPRSSIRSLPAAVVVVVVAVVAAAAGVVVADLLRGVAPPSPAEVTTGAVFLAAGVLHHETALGVDRLRRRTPGVHHVDLNSVWTFAAAILLPPVAASAVVVGLYLYLHLRTRRPLRAPVHRQVYSTATIVLAVHAAAAVITLPVFERLGSFAVPVAVAAGLLAYTAVNTGLVLGVVALAGPGVRVLRVPGTGHEMALELATLCLGALAAGMLASSTPFVLLLVIPPILVLHRTMPLRELEEQADTDAKTGLLNAAAWHARAGRALDAVARERGTAGLLVLDLDMFKTVNDRHGHLAGDEVLGAIARTLRAEVRGHDLVGRFGGEEFVVLLPHLSGSADHAEVRRIADRIRRRVGEVRVEVSAPDGPRTIEAVTVSVGGAVFPQDGDGLTALVETADSALYAAKRAGRDTVRTGAHGFGTRGPRRPRS
ncbi:MAG: GGDEF domain-containing protein [Pseudonocardia sediminis]